MDLECTYLIHLFDLSYSNIISVGWGVGGIEAEAVMLNQPVRFQENSLAFIDSYLRFQWFFLKLLELNWLANSLH